MGRRVTTTANLDTGILTPIVEPANWTKMPSGGSVQPPGTYLKAIDNVYLQKYSGQAGAQYNGSGVASDFRAPGGALLQIPESAYNVKVKWMFTVFADSFTDNTAGRTINGQLLDAANNVLGAGSVILGGNQIGLKKSYGWSPPIAVSAAQVNAGLQIKLAWSVPGGSPPPMYIGWDWAAIEITYSVDTTVLYPSPIRTVMMEKFREGWERVFGKREWREHPSGLLLPQ